MQGLPTETHRQKQAVVLQGAFALDESARRDRLPNAATWRGSPGRGRFGPGRASMRLSARLTAFTGNGVPQKYEEIRLTIGRRW